MTDFTAYKHPVMAVACPDCGAGVGHYCKRPSGHKAWGGFHRSRNQAADRAWLDQGAPLIAHELGRWVIRAPRNDRERGFHQNEIIETRRALRVAA